MPFIFKKRDTQSREYMDDPNCNRNKLFNTYQQFSAVNRFVSGWKRIYQKHIKPVLYDGNQPCTLLDIGFGGGDIPIKLAKWAAEDSIRLHITAIETDPRAMEFVQTLNIPKNIAFKLTSSTDLAAQGKSFDIVISNHLIHHLDEKSLQQLLTDSQILSRKLVLFNDLKRSDCAYLLFNLFSPPFFRNSFITRDGLISIKRSYTVEELCKRIPEGWQVQPVFPFRLLLHCENQGI